MASGFALPTPVSIKGTPSGAPSAEPRSAARRAPWLILALTAALALAALLGAAGTHLAAASAPSDDSPEAGFARDMATHHRQAVEMAFLILDRSDDPRIKTLATDVLATQQHQVGQMYAWLDIWGLPQAAADPPMTWMGHPVDGPMPGMATQSELRALAELTGPAADIEFLRLMIRHHQGGAPMAEAILDRSDDEIVTRLARAIVQSQSAEVHTMETMLTERGGSPLPPPTTEHTSSLPAPPAYSRSPNG